MERPGHRSGTRYDEMMRSPPALLVATVVFGLWASTAHGAAARQPNAAELQRGIERLGVTGSVLYIAAHPDDENTRLLAWLANHAQVRTAYLSLTRGEGGQNLIGAEQQP